MKMTEHLFQSIIHQVLYTIKYYTPYFNVLIDGKSFFHVPIKNKKQVYENIIEMSQNNDHTTGTLECLIKGGLE